MLAASPTRPHRGPLHSVGLVYLVCLLWGAGCGFGGGGADGAPPCTGSVSFEADVQPILTANCIDSACHDSDLPAVGLSLTSPGSYENLVDMPSSECDGRTRVVPGSPIMSYMYDKLTDRKICSGSAMPKGRPRLSDDDLHTLRTWICTGAAND